MKFKVYMKRNPNACVEFETDTPEKAQRSALRRMNKADYMPEGKPKRSFGTLGWIERDGKFERSVVYGSSRSDSYGGMKTIDLVLEEIQEEIQSNGEVDNVEIPNPNGKKIMEDDYFSTEEHEFMIAVTDTLTECESIHLEDDEARDVASDVLTDWQYVDETEPKEVSIKGAKVVKGNLLMHRAKNRVTRLKLEGYRIIDTATADRFLKIFRGRIGVVEETDYMFKQGVVGETELVNTCGDRVAYVE